MRVPQELVDDIVTRVQRWQDLLTLIRASEAVFSSQVCLSLHDVVVHIASDDSQYALRDALQYHPSTLSHIHRLEISRDWQPNHSWEADHFPKLMDACTELRELRISMGCCQGWVDRFPPLHRLAIYRSMQRLSLEELHLEGASFSTQALKELLSVPMPPGLRHLSLLQATIARDAQIFTAPYLIDDLTLRGTRIVVESLAIDHTSVLPGMLIFGGRAHDPERELRELHITGEPCVPTLYGRSLDLVTRRLLKDNPQLMRLTLTIGRPTHECSAKGRPLLICPRRTPRLP